MKKSLIFLAVLSLLLVGCATKPVYITHYIVNGEEYQVQNEGQFANPGTPKEYLTDRQEFIGWSLDGQLITDWSVQPLGDINVYAEIKNINYIDLYINGKPYKAISETELAKMKAAPAIPTSEEISRMFKKDELENFSEGYSFKDNTFIGWTVNGTNEFFEDWDKPLTKSIKLNAIYKPIVFYYVNNTLWKQQYVSEFANPGAPEDTELYNGYEFAGWVNYDDYGPYENWNEKPEILRFDALLSLTSTDSAILNSSSIELDSRTREYSVLGPVTISDTCQIVNGKIKTTGVGYKDILAEAKKLYPATDKVIDIIVDYETKELDVDYSALQNGIVSKPSAKRFVYQTASYTGLAIDIKDAVQTQSESKSSEE